MTTGLAEVSESEAQGKVKTTYEDIKATLRTPVVSLLWRILATEPDFLLPAWTALKPNVQTVYFERRADLIRQAAIGAVAAWGAAPQSPEEAAGAIKVFHYLNPKLLLATAALRAAAYGQQPRLVELPREEKRQLPFGVPADTAAVDLEVPGAGAPGVAGVIEVGQEAFGLTAPPCELRALAR